MVFGFIFYNLNLLPFYKYISNIVLFKKFYLMIIFLSLFKSTFYQTFIDLLETYKLTTDITFSNVNSILLEFIRITGTQKTSKPNKSKQNGRFGIKRKSKRRNRKNRKNRKNKSKRTRRMKSKKI